MFWKVFRSASSSLRRDKLEVNVKIFSQKKKSYSCKLIGNGWWLFYSGELLQVVDQIFYFYVLLCAVSAFVSSRMTWFHFLGFSAFWKIFSSLKDLTGSVRKVPEHSGAVLSLSPIGIILSSGIRRELLRHFVTQHHTIIKTDQQGTHWYLPKWLLFQCLEAGFFLVFCGVFLIGFVLS